MQRASYILAVGLVALVLLAGRTMAADNLIDKMFEAAEQAAQRLPSGSSAFAPAGWAAGAGSSRGCASISIATQRTRRCSA